MAFNIQYKSLFEVSFRHGYFLNRGATEFEQLPPEEQDRRLSGFDLSTILKLTVPQETQRTLAGLGCLMKPTASGFRVAMEVQQDKDRFLPKRAPLQPFRLLFVLESRDANFWNYTNSRFEGVQSAIYLSNRVGKLSGAFPDLALPPIRFSAGSANAAGSVVVDESGDVFLSIRNDRDDLPPPNQTKWVKLGRHNYVTKRDEVSIQPLSFALVVPADMTKVTKLNAVDADGKRTSIKFDFREPNELNVDASTLAQGAYSLEVTGADEAGDQVELATAVYLAPELIGRNIIAMIELFHLQGDGIDDQFQLYDQANGFALKQPEFLVRFLNRHTFWRYQFLKKPDGFTGANDLDDNSVTKQAMPLTQSAQDVSFGRRKLPNPSTNFVSPETNRVYSNIPIHFNPKMES